MNRNLKKLSIDDMLHEIKRRNRLIATLNRRRQTLLTRVEEVEQQIKDHGGDIKRVSMAGLPGGRRPRNEMSLPDAMAKVMSKDKAMSVSQIEQAVNKIGYRSVSTTFKTIIFQALAKDARFKKMARGQYVLK